jgi:acetylornithine deacetylase/succinyl-diaminopimelate desuccinylase-like protein
LLGSPSLTVTRIHGGHADNVVPDSCELLLDRRMLPGESEDDVRIQFEKLLAEAKALHGVDAEIVDRAVQRKPVPTIQSCSLPSNRHIVTASTMMRYMACRVHAILCISAQSAPKA